MLHLQQRKKKHKNLFDEAHQTNSGFQEHDLVLLHNTKLNNHFDQKLAFCWLESYCICQAIIEKEIYLLAELNGTHLLGTILNNRLKWFMVQISASNESMQADGNSNVPVEKGQSELVVENADLDGSGNENEVMSDALISEKVSSTVREMQDDDLMVLPASLISVSELRNQSQRLMLEVILPSL